MLQDRCNQALPKDTCNPRLPCKKDGYAQLHNRLSNLVPEVGLEPTRCYPLDFESSASAIPPLRRLGTIAILHESLDIVNNKFKKIFN